MDGKGLPTGLVAAPTKSHAARGQVRCFPSRNRQQECATRAPDSSGSRCRVLNRTFGRVRLHEPMHLIRQNLQGVDGNIQLLGLLLQPRLPPAIHRTDQDRTAVLGTPNQMIFKATASAFLAYWPTFRIIQRAYTKGKQKEKNTKRRNSAFRCRLKATVPCGPYLWERVANRAGRDRWRRHSDGRCGGAS